MSDFADFLALTLWQQVVVVLLLIDLTGGVVANLSFSTNTYYQDRPKLRLIFLSIHLQPLIFILVYPLNWQICVVIWLVTLSSALIVNALNRSRFQRELGMMLMCSGIIGLVIGSQGVPHILLLSLMIYHLKLSYSFAVNHFQQ